MGRPILFSRLVSAYSKTKYLDLSVNKLRILFATFLPALLLSCKDIRENNGSGRFFRYNQASGISSLDPAFAKDQANIWAVNQLFNALIQLDDQLRPQPCLAKSWSISPDGLSYTFSLNTGVYFHDDPCFPNGKGRRMSASDIVYSFQRLVNPETASPGAWIFNGRVDSLNPFSAPNDSTFVLKLKSPFLPVLGLLSMAYCSVVPHEALEKYGNRFGLQPVGTGPFRFKNWKEGTALVLHKNPKYFETVLGVRLPFLDGVRITFIDNKKTEFLLFKRKEIDFVSGLDAAYIDEVLKENGDIKQNFLKEFKVEKSAYLNTEYLGFLMTDTSATNPLRDSRIRRAINYGFDRKELIKYLRNGLGKPALQGFTPPGLPSFDDSLIGFDYDPKQTADLLEQAGYPGGRGLPMISLYTNNTYKEIALFIASRLEQSGIRIKVEVVQPAVLREWMSQGKVPFFRGSWIADYPDAESYFTVFYSGNTAPPNYTRFKNTEFDRLYLKSLAEVNDSVRFAQYRQLEKILISEAPVVPLYYDEVLRLCQKNVDGITPNGLNLLNIKYIKFRE